MTYDVACPICGRVNRRLYLEETEGWMECESCGTSSQHFPFANKWSCIVKVESKNPPINCYNNRERTVDHEVRQSI